MTGQRIGIVGAGILGCLIAHEVVRRCPNATVVVLERDEIGCGASRRSAGLHFPRGSSERVRKMATLSEDYYRNLRWRWPNAPIHPLAMYVVASGAAKAEVERTYLKSAQLTLTDLAPDEAVTVPTGSQAWAGHGCQYAEVAALVQLLVRDLRPSVSVREGVRVTALELGADGVTVRVGTGDTVTVDRLVLAPGPWVHDRAWQSLVAPLGLRVKKVVALHVDDVPMAPDRVAIFHDEDAFLLPLVYRGHWLFSTTCQDWDVDPDAAPEGLAASHLDQAREVLGRYAPGLAVRICTGRVFCDAYSPDRQPVVRALDDAGRVVFAGATNGSGYRLAPAIAAEAADLLQLGEERDQL
jgi:D-arginine dehydrogenase